MHKITNLSIKGEQFESFRTRAGFDAIKPINVIIGKNNSGKSSLLDLVHQAIGSNKVPLIGTRQRRATS